jgi:hypothetical protein
MSVHRLRRPIRLRKWPKVLGLLVLLSWFAILVYPSSSQQTAEVLVAKSNIFAGERVLPSDFETRSLVLGDIEGAYLRVNEIPEDATASREILAGELLAKTAIGRTEQVLIPLALPLAQAPASQIRVGCSVNVWATAVHLGTVDGQPEPIALNAWVSAIKLSASMGQERAVVEVLVQKDFVPPLLLAQADGSVISLVLNPTLANQ